MYVSLKISRAINILFKQARVNSVSLSPMWLWFNIMVPKKLKGSHSTPSNTDKLSLQCALYCCARRIFYIFFSDVKLEDKASDIREKYKFRIGLQN